MKFSLLILPLMLSTTACLAAHKHCQIKIAIVDTGLDLNDPRFERVLCKTGHKNFVNEESLNDMNGHGTHVAGLIQKYAKNVNYCMLVYKYYTDSVSGEINQKRELLAFKEAIKNGANLVNFSGGGTVFSEEEAIIIKSHPEVTFVVAAGNEGKNIDISENKYYPASLFLQNMEVVGSIGNDGFRTETSNYSTKIVDKELGQNVLSYLPHNRMGHKSGTSMATAIFSGKLLAKYPNMCQSVHRGLNVHK